MKLLAWLVFAVWVFITWRIFKVTLPGAVVFAAVSYVVVFANGRRHCRLIRAGKRPRA